jgi:cytochrome c553
VLVTASGKKYHVEGCSSLSISKAPLSLAEAVAKGYTPCTRCEAPTLKPEAVVIPAPAAQSPTPTNPPPAADPIVYITKSGKKYHAEGCSSLSNSKVAVRLSEAKAKELEPCSRCKPDGDGGKP